MATDKTYPSGLRRIGGGTAESTHTEHGIATPDSIEAAIAAVGGKLPMERVADGTMLAVRKTGVTWPARPTTRTDLMVVWVGAEPAPPVGGTGMVEAVDLWWDITPRPGI